MSDEVTPGAWEIIKIMRQVAAGSDVPDMVAVEMVQELADIADRARSTLPENDIAALVGIGAMLVNQADTEMKAMIDGFVAMGRIRTTGEPGQ